MIKMCEASIACKKKKLEDEGGKKTVWARDDRLIVPECKSLAR